MLEQFAEEAPEPWLTPYEQRVWRRLLSVEDRLTQRLDRDLRSLHQISLGDYGVLVHLSEARGEALRMSELAERLLISRSGLTRRIDALERRGLVARHACPADGRGALARLTASGRAKLEEAAPAHVRGVRSYLIDPLGSLGGLDAGLAAVEAALDRH